MSRKIYEPEIKNSIIRLHLEEGRTLSSLAAEYNGVPGHRMMEELLVSKEGVLNSKVTVYKYMKELGLRSVARKKKPAYVKGTAHKTFLNYLNRNFVVSKPNKIWCTDFTYMNLSNGSKRYNCTIIDLYDRSVVATLNGKEITSQLAISTLKKALMMHNPGDGKLILHSDHGFQYTSKEFTEFCSKQCITQSMSRAGCPYDNAPMERYYNSFKSELVNLFNFKDDASLNSAVIAYAYRWYNHVRPHSYNGGKTPFQARYSTS